jgi:hypothetical protein
MPLLLGSAPNQVPTNGDLGTAAFIDAEQLPVSTLQLSALSTKQDSLVSGVNIKTVNEISLVGSGNILVGSVIYRVQRTSNSVILTTNRSSLIDITSGTFTQTFTAAATLADGWFCYIRNSGTGDITLDPNGSELIDGLTSYIMYSGETRLVQCDGTAFRSIVINTFNKKFTSSGTFVKPPGYATFDCTVYGGGGSGARGFPTNNGSMGGDGGGCLIGKLVATLFGSTEAITIGAGGAAQTTASTLGNQGGASSIGSLLSISKNVSAGFRDDFTNNGTIYSGALVSTTNSGGSVVVGSSVYGGAGGGSKSTTAVLSIGTSIFGGKGGAYGESTNGSIGIVPGGGGGATNTGTQSGAGARGEVTIQGVI